MLSVLLGALLATATPPPPVDPLLVTIEAEDADRFARLFERTGGKPSAEQIQKNYLDPGSYGVHVFTPNRIESAANVAAAIAKDPAKYRKAVTECMPVIKGTTAELRATYLALHGLLPERPLPHIYLVVGAGTSGGTAGPGAQVLGLETLCAIAKDADALREIVRGFYAHETVHTFQQESDTPSPGGVLLDSVLAEGAADFITAMVTGRQPDAARAAWAAPREAELWEQLEADLAATRGKGWNDVKRGTPAGTALRRWVNNYGAAPDGWHYEAGYWMGQRIWQRWYDRQPDKQAALRAMLEQRDPEQILREGRLRR